MSRKKELWDRVHRIGSADVAAIAGLSPYKDSTPLSVWQHKAPPGKRPFMEEGDHDNETLQAGRILEPALKELYMARTGNMLAKKKPAPIFIDHYQASPDAVGRDTGNNLRIVELKAVGLGKIADWREEEPPPYVQVQVQWQMLVARLVGWDNVRADVAALIGGPSMEIYQLAPDEMMQAGLAEIADDFWHTYVLPGVPPPPLDSENLNEYARRLYPRVKGNVVSYDEPEATGWEAFSVTTAANLVAAYRAQRDTVSRETVALDELAGQLKLAIGDNAAIDTLAGMVSWNQRKGNPRWKEAVEELAKVRLPTNDKAGLKVYMDTLAERFRGEPSRVLRDHGEEKEDNG